MVSEYSIIHADVIDGLAQIDDGSVQTCVTSPPYWGLRDYGVDGQLGLEKTPEEYVERMVVVFREVRRVLRDDGTLWLNLGDCYASQGCGGGSPVDNRKPEYGRKGYDGDKVRGREQGTKTRNTVVSGLKPKDLVGIPWRVAFALQADGWYLRQDIIWHKSNPMPESVRDRCTKAHEYIFLLTKNARYYYDEKAIAEPLNSSPDSWGRHSKKDHGLAAVNPRPMFGPGRDGRDGTEWGNSKTRNRRSVWTIATQPFPEAHYATYPPKLIEPCILAGSAPGDVVLDPFLGSGTTVMVALRHGRKAIGIELSETNVEMAHKRIQGDMPLFNAKQIQADQGKACVFGNRKGG